MNLQKNTNFLRHKQAQKAENLLLYCLRRFVMMKKSRLVNHNWPIMFENTLIYIWQ